MSWILASLLCANYVEMVLLQFYDLGYDIFPIYIP